VDIHPSNPIYAFAIWPLIVLQFVVPFVPFVLIGMPVAIAIKGRQSMGCGAVWGGAVGCVFLAWMFYMASRMMH